VQNSAAPTSALPLHRCAARQSASSSRALPRIGALPSCPPPRAPATPPTWRGGARRYNTVMKLVFLVSSATIVYYMRFHRVVRNTYDREVDTFRVVFLVAPCALAALVINQEFTPLEVPPRAPAGVLPALRRRLFWTG